VSLVSQLGLLGYFKYGGFLLENFTWLVQRAGLDFSPAAPDIVLPVGISFYTFQTLSYTFGVYRGEDRPCRSFLDYALFVTFFPQLVAGPIVRAHDFLPQCVEPRRASPRQLGFGLALLTFGLFQKSLLADAVLAPVSDAVFGAPARAGALDAWIGTLAFSGQIFFDFAGYSACAIGAAACLGFALPENFRCPYAALGFSDFWRRWHVSLSSWLRDYLYRSLGGNRRGAARTTLNLLLTMLIGGLWHGAGWHFVVWGGLHGIYLVAERALRGEARRAAPARRAPRLALAAGTFLLVSLTWIFFRAPSLGDALAMAAALARAAPAQLVSAGQAASVLAVMAAALAAQWRWRDADLQSRVESWPLWLRSGALALALIALLLAPGEDRAFIYFQF
jgi:alginate O-acetyltransferase complex protein AlgI